MTQDEIINLAIENTIHGLKFDEEGLLRFAKLVAKHERERIFGELVKMHEIASSRYNYYLNAVLTIKARGQA